MNNGKQHQQQNQSKEELAKGNRKLFDCCHIFLCHICNFCLIGWLCRKYIFHRKRVDMSNTKNDIQIDRSNRGKLASVNNNAYSSVLSSYKTICRGSIPAVASEKETSQKTAQREENSSNNREIMPTRILHSKYHIPIEFFVERRRPRVRYIVESQYPVTVYLMDEDDLSDFENGRSFGYYVGAKRRRYHEEDIKLTYSGIYYLVIINEGNKSTAIHYELYE